MSRLYTFALTTSIALGVVASALAQQPAPATGRQGQGAQAQTAAPRPAPVRRPGLFFKEEWQQNEKGDEHPVTQQSIANPDLELKLYGESAKEVQLTGKAGDENNPIHVWTGLCTSPCAVAFRHKAGMADLSGLGRIRWNTKMSGFHKVRPIVKLADGTWLIGDREEGTTTDWIFSEFNLSDVRWLRLDINRVVTTGNYVANPDLTKVDEIGFADLMPGSGHGPGGWSDVAQFEVYGKAVPR
jgi:hypothetical protein